jgi:glutamate formiminotransferase/formiminotetrahydrofolate cyclodeaminase
MVCGLTIGKKKYADVWSEMEKIRGECQTLRKRLLGLAEEDSRAYEQVLKSRRALRVRPEEVPRREAVRAAALKAAEVPLEVCDLSVKALEFSRAVAEKGNVNSVSDAGVSACMAHAALVGASLNVYINLGSIDDESRRTALLRQTQSLRDVGEGLYKETRELVERKLFGN